MIIETSSPPPTNQQSILSLCFGILTRLTVCVGVIPIPFTGFICFPAGILSALVALISGVISLSQIHRRGERGDALAWTGILIGGFTIMVFLCILMALLGLLFFRRSGPFSIHLPGDYQI